MPRSDEAAREPRSMALAQGALDYTLVRRRGRRGIGLRVDATGLTVSAPLSSPLSQIEKMVAQSEPWVRGKLAIWRQRQVPVQRWEEGEGVLLLGERLALRVQTGKRPLAEKVGAELLVKTPVSGEEAVKRAVISWYRRTALAHFAHRTFLFARLSGLTPPRVMLSSALSRWGSCNSRREIRLSWRLVKARAELVDYVVCHELAHLRHMNHSAQFWSEVGRLCPDYRVLRDELENHDHLYRSF